jgi:hypothetical protein
MKLRIESKAEGRNSLTASNICRVSPVESAAQQWD